MDNIEALVEQMGHLGFSQYETRAYCALLQKSPLNGHEVSRTAGIPPSKIYETLQRLLQKGAVLIYRSEPTLYAPVSARDLLARLRQHTETTFHNVEEGLQKLAQETDTGLTWSLVGRTNLLDTMRQTIARTQHSLFGALWDQEMAELAEPLREAYRRGIKLQIAIYGTFELGVPDTYDLTLCGESAQDRLGGRRLAVLVGDQGETVTTEFDTNKNTGSQGIWTKNPVISLLATEYIKEEIMGRCLINELGDERYQQLRRKRPALIAMLKPES